MSNVFKALEKAERERGKEREPKIDLPPLPEDPETPRREEVALERRMIEETGLPQIITSVQQTSQVGEQFRKLRSQILKFKGPDSPRTIMVTSAMNSEGKTFVAVNLAAGIARELHMQALLVDCDLRNPSVTGLFDLPKMKGLSDYLAGDGASRDAILKTRMEKLELLPAGRIQENPTELIGSKKMEVLLEELKAEQSNRYIVLDSTPILATTEPEVLARLVDGIVFVVRAGVTPRETIQQAMRSIGKEKVIGVVLNDLVFKSSALNSRYFGSDGYYYRYGYGYGKKGSENNKKWWQKIVRRNPEKV
jgi:exopolysaccharide/PEP-CTERM locus tyrosine autokinase